MPGIEAKAAKRIVERSGLAPKSKDWLKNEVDLLLDEKGEEIGAESERQKKKGDFNALACSMGPAILDMACRRGVCNLARIKVAEILKEIILGVHRSMSDKGHEGVEEALAARDIGEADAHLVSAFLRNTRADPTCFHTSLEEAEELAKLAGEEHSDKELLDWLVSKGKVYNYKLTRFNHGRRMFDLAERLGIAYPEIAKLVEMQIDKLLDEGIIQGVPKENLLGNCLEEWERIRERATRHRGFRSVAPQSVASALIQSVCRKKHGLDIVDSVLRGYFGLNKGGYSHFYDVYE